MCRLSNATCVATVRVKNGEMTMENCYGLTAADFEHEVGLCRLNQVDP
jgi:hypothetical protein